MTSRGCRAATPVQVRGHVRTCLLDLADDRRGGPASTDGLPARRWFEARLPDAMLAEELAGLTDVTGLAFWADTLRLGLSSLVNDGMASADAAAVFDLAIRCLDQNDCSPAYLRHLVQTTALRSVLDPALSSFWRTHTVFGGEYAR